METGVVLSRTVYGDNGFCSNVAVKDENGIYRQRRLIPMINNFFNFDSFSNYSSRQIKEKWIPRRVIKFQSINHRIKEKRRFMPWSTRSL